MRPPRWLGPVLATCIALELFALIADGWVQDIMRAALTVIFIGVNALSLFDWTLETGRAAGRLEAPDRAAREIAELREALEDQRHRCACAACR
jgi:hypothetical protein